jgi:predicted Zn-dependent protease
VGLLALYGIASRGYRPWQVREPDLAAAHLRLAADDFRRGRVTDAIAEGEKAVRAAPDNPVARYNLACYLVEGSRFDEAARELQRTLDLAPDFAPAALLLQRLRAAGS